MVTSSATCPDLPARLRSLLEERYPPAPRRAAADLMGSVQRFELALAAAVREVRGAAAAACPAPGSRGAELGCDRSHEHYPEFLPDQAPEEIWRQFAGMVGPPLACGPVRGADHVTALYAAVAAHNHAAALGVAGTPAPSWDGQKVVLWRGCWAILARTKPNRRRPVPGASPAALNVKLEPDAH